MIPVNLKGEPIKGKHFLCQIDDIFTKDECQQLLKRANDQGWHDPETGGNYTRAIIIDRELADNLFIKLKKYIPDEYLGFKLVYINDHFRFSKYNDGGIFPIHKDGHNYDASRVEEYNGYSTESVFTLNIFLNDDFVGGETDFFAKEESDDEEPNDDESDIFSVPKTLNLRFRAIPKCGRGALFYGQQYHRGNKVLEGYKYLIRTDVMGLKN